jgi:hypothetical protein
MYCIVHLLVLLYLTFPNNYLLYNIYSYVTGISSTMDVVKIVPISANSSIMDAVLSETTDKCTRRCEHCNPHPQRSGVTTRGSCKDNQAPCVIHDCLICTRNEEGVVVSSYPNTAVWPPLLVK